MGRVVDILGVAILGALLIGVLGFFSGVLAGEETLAKTCGCWGVVIGGAAGMIAGAILFHGQQT